MLAFFSRESWQKQILYLLLLLAATLTSYSVWEKYFIWHPMAVNPRYPDEFAEQVTVIRTDQQGNIEDKFFVPKIWHFSPSDRTLFYQPQMSMTVTQQPPWVANAQWGEATNGNAMIHLWGNVTITQQKGVHNAAGIIQTSSLLLYPHTHEITTDQYISAQQGGLSATSVGMQLNIDQHTLALLSQVSGTYVNHQTTHITANHALLNNLTHIGVFTNNVHLTRDTKTLSSQQLTLFANQDNQLLKAIAKGELAEFIAQPQKNKPPVHAFAQTIEYDPLLAKIVLTGNAKVEQGPNSYSAPKIDYNINQQQVITPHEKHGRVSIVIQPQTLKKPK